MNIYREQIPREHLAVFRKSVEKAAKEADSSTLGYIGLIGSGLTSEVPHDIDILVFPNENTSVGNSILAMNQFYKDLDTILQEDHGLFIAPFSRKIMQVERTYLVGQSKGNEGKLPSHTIFFPDYNSLKRITPENFLESVAKSSEPIIGDFNVIFRCEDKPQEALEPYFMIADYQIPLLYDRYPEILILRKTEEIIDYLASHYGIKFDKTRGLETPESCVKLVDNLLLELDRREEKVA